MSESSKATTLTPLQRNKMFIIIIIAGLVLLSIGYVGGYFAFPSLIKSAYQAKSCETMISRYDLYRSAYPIANEENEMVDLVRECAVYTLALANEGSEAWHDSYNAFSVYSETYVQGLFVGEVHEHSAIVLMGLVNEEVETKDYLKANDSLDYILENYSDTTTAAEAEKLKSDLRVELGAYLRETGDFAGAEGVFNDLLTLSKNTNNTENIKTAYRDLAQTYLDWGMALQLEKQFEGALAKYELTLETDPDPSSTNSLASQAKSGMITLYTQWGDYLIEQTNYSDAIGYYETAATLSDDQSEAMDIIAQGYTQWAIGLGNNDDFIGALTLLNLAQETASTATKKESVDQARSDIYLSLSRSSGK